MGRFGTLDQIGNVWEWTDDLTYDKSNFMRFYGTAQNAQPYGAQSLPTADGWYSTWNYIRGFISATGGSGSGDYFWWPGTNSTSPANGGASGSGWAAFRGGAWYGGVGAGRFALFLDFSPSNVNTFLGGRCALSSP